MRDAAISLLVGLFLSTTSCPADALPSTCRPEYQKLSGGLVHTACKPPNNNCIFVSTGLNMAEKADVLKAHNDFRSRVAQGQLSGFPAATNMYRMKWDDDLAQVAQAFTNLCDDRHDKEVQRKTSKFPKVGQNIAWNYEPTQTEVIDSAGRVKDWFEEYQDFNSGNVDPFRVSHGRVVTHFTQVAWAETRYIGCGYTHYKLRNDDNPRFPYKKLFACNYAPGGNMIGKSMYKIGAACSACPTGTVCDKATALCTEDEGNFNQTIVPPPHDNVTTPEPITKEEDKRNINETIVQPPHENVTTSAPITKYTPGESDGLDSSGGSTGSQWGIIAFFLLGIIAMAAVCIGIIYVRSVTLRSSYPTQQPCTS